MWVLQESLRGKGRCSVILLAGLNTTWAVSFSRRINIYILLFSWEQRFLQGVHCFYFINGESIISSLLHSLVTSFKLEVIFLLMTIID